jgi:hypothetical protein
MLQFLTISDPVKIRAAVIQVGHMVSLLASARDSGDRAGHHLQPVARGAGS